MGIRILFKALTIATFALCAGQSWAATMTVDAAGGGDYTSLKAAVDDMNNDVWGAEPHTILVTDNQVNPINERIVVIRSVEIRNADGDQPVFLVDMTNLGNNFIIYVAGAHDYTFDGLTFIGNVGSTPSDSDNTMIRAENGEGARQTLTVRNCLITANNGSDQPLTDYTLDPGPVRGFFFHPVLPYRGDNASPIDTTIENCTFAYCSRGVAMYNAPVSGGSLTIRNTLFAQKMDFFVYLNNLNYAGVPITLDECALIYSNEGDSDTDGNMIMLQGSNLNVTISDSIFRSKWNTAVRLEAVPDITLVMQRVTAHVRRQALFANFGDVSANRNITLRDLIWKYYEPRITNGGLGYVAGEATFTVSNLAFYEGRWDSSDGAAPMTNLRAALAGMSQPIVQDDPLFVSSALDSSYNGLVGWNRLDNTLYDVDNHAFYAKGAPGERPGNALTGGADPTERVPVTLSRMSIE